MTPEQKAMVTAAKGRGLKPKAKPKPKSKRKADAEGAVADKPVAKKEGREA